MAKSDIISKIEEMKTRGELTTEQSVSLILTLVLELYVGQDEIKKGLDDRQGSIDELKKQFTAHEAKTSDNSKEHYEMKTRLDTIEKTIEDNKKEIDTVKDTSIVIWMGKHKTLSWMFTIILILSINLHDLIVPYLLSLFNFKLPGG
jgi:hypothetical protein